MVPSYSWEVALFACCGEKEWPKWEAQSGKQAHEKLHLPTSGSDSGCVGLGDQPYFAQSVYEAYTFTTLAGNTNSGSADGLGTAAQFYLPSKLAVDAAGNIYVADYGNSTIRKITAEGLVTTLAGLAGSTGSVDGIGSAARFNWPGGVALDKTGNIYVADKLNHAIRKVRPTGEVTPLAGNADSQGSEDGIGSDARFDWPGSIAADANGNLYVADANYVIRKVTSAGVVTTLAGSAGNLGSADGTGSEARFGAQIDINRFAGPGGLAVGSAGDVFVPDVGNCTIRKITPDGVVTTLAGKAGQIGFADGMGSVARFYRPDSVAVDNLENIYVAEYGSHTIRKVTPTGNVTTLAGLFEVNDNGTPLGGNADGTGNAARFNQPIGVAVDRAGNLYVADRNNTIRKGYPAPRFLSSKSDYGFQSGQFALSLTGPAGKSVVVEVSADLANWLPLWTNTFTFPAALTFNDPQSSVSTNRFYRVRVRF